MRSKLTIVCYGSSIGLGLGFFWGLLWVVLLMTGSATVSDLFWDIHGPLMGLFEPILHFLGPPDAIMVGLIVLWVLFSLTGLTLGFLVSVVTVALYGGEIDDS